MLLAVDIGNTNITFGIFNNKILIKSFRVVSDINLSEKTYRENIKNETANIKITDCIIASVVKNLDVKIKSIIDDMFIINSLIFNQNSETGIKIKVQNPFEVGKDRIANAIASKKYHLPVIVVDIGTATTFDIINNNGEFIGGIIMPGVNTQLKSLKLSTSLLPEITLSEVYKTIGSNTENAILTGVVQGHACAIEGLIEKCEEELGNSAFIIGTGGMSHIISRYMKKPFDVIDMNLTLDGLRMLYELNTCIC